MAINKVLPNGARFYVDHAHPEFSTPECSNVLDLMRYEKAGERILNLSRLGANQLIPSDRTIIIYKNNSDQKGNSYGYHENYLMDRRTPFQTIAERLCLFSCHGRFFVVPAKLGQKTGRSMCRTRFRNALTFLKRRSASTRWSNARLSTPVMSHMPNRDRYRRLHVIVGDANMSEYTTYLKVGTSDGGVAHD